MEKEYRLEKQYRDCKGPYTLIDPKELAIEESFKMKLAWKEVYPNHFVLDFDSRYRITIYKNLEEQWVGRWSCGKEVIAIFPPIDTLEKAVKYAVHQTNSWLEQVVKELWYMEPTAGLKL